MRGPDFARLSIGLVVLLAGSICVAQLDEGDTAEDPGSSGEICVNSVDDDGDSLVDCHDPDCTTMVRMTLSGVVSSVMEGIGCEGAFHFPPPFDSITAGDEWSLTLIYDGAAPPTSSFGNRRSFIPAISTFTFEINGLDASTLFTEQPTFRNIELLSDTPVFSSCTSMAIADVAIFNSLFAARVEPDSCSPRGFSLSTLFADLSLTLFPGLGHSGIPTSLLPLDTGDFSLATGRLSYGAFNETGARIEICPAEEFSIQLLTCEVCDDGIDNDGDDLVDCDDPDCTDWVMCNRPPECLNDLRFDLWPPNHKYENVDTQEFLMVLDPDGDKITVAVTGIAQDEGINGTGDGDSTCDAEITGDTTFKIRRERQGGGNGRVYTVSYRAEDGNGGACQGSFEIGIPADKEGPSAINDGPLIDSLACASD